MIDEHDDQPGNAESLEATAPTTERDEQPFPPRGVLTLRALRWGGLIAVVAFALIALLLAPVGSSHHRVLPPGTYWLLAAIPTGWFVAWLILTSLKKANRLLTGCLVVTLCAPGCAATVLLVRSWWRWYRGTGFSIPFFLVLAAVPVSATLLAVISTLLCHRTIDSPAVMTGSQDLSSWTFLTRRAENHDGDSPPASGRVRLIVRTRLYLGAVVVVPSLILGTAVAGVYLRADPVTQVIASPPADDALPSRPVSPGPKAAWSTDLPTVDAMVSGAAGPIVLSGETIMALNPANGAILWNYHHEGARYIVNESSLRDTSTLVTSPNGRYVAVRIEAPEIMLRDPGISPTDADEGTAGEAARKSVHHVTVVLNALTGAVIHRLDSAGGCLQLTDSAILNGDNAVSIADGRTLWTLPEPCDYSGPAGHASFIVPAPDEQNTPQGGATAEAEQPESPVRSATRLGVIAQTDPSNVVGISEILTDLDLPDSEDEVAIVDGWAAQYTQETDESGHAEAQAVSLDAMAKVEGADTSTYPLGPTAGINIAASTASGTLAVYPALTAGEPLDLSLRQETERVSMVFDPVTRAVTPAARDSGFASARFGILSPTSSNVPQTSIVIRPASGAAGTTIPVESHGAPWIRTPAQLMLAEGGSRWPQMKMLNAPGIMLVALDTTDQDHCRREGRGYSTCPRTYRVYGVPAGR